MQIQGNLPIRPTPSGTTVAPGSSGVEGFTRTLSDTLKDVNRMQLQADAGAQSVARGETDNLQQVMLQTEEASLAFNMTVQFRNKAVEAYQEVMRMQF